MVGAARRRLSARNITNDRGRVRVAGIGARKVHAEYGIPDAGRRILHRGRPRSPAHRTELKAQAQRTSRRASSTLPPVVLNEMVGALKSPGGAPRPISPLP